MVQSSATDCGPAALKSLMEGFGLPVSYGRLREACQTDVDGTSIDRLEETANALGLDASQMMAPPDHLLLAQAGGAVSAWLFAAWVGLGSVFAWRYAKERTAWTEARLNLTQEVVESMSGHRTRLAQQPPDQWHDGEDQALESYLVQSARLDRTGVRLTALIPRGWLVVGVASLLPAFFGGAPASLLAVSVGGVLLAQMALRRLSAGMSHLAGAAISWRQVEPLFRAAANYPTCKPMSDESTAPVRTVLEASEIAFRYREGGRTVLDRVNLRIERGDRVLLEGESGGGKSTLVSLLAGLRMPSEGMLTSGGLDRAALGSASWRKRVAAAPQYHENHVLAGSFLFNVLMARVWPPTREDIQEAETVCRELGLGPLLDRMPAGIQQMIGETGWQLSQGERSRLFLARALLQKSQMVVLDESFAALDPESLRQSLECALRRAPSLLVVAHP